MYHKRTSIIKNIRIRALTFTSIFEIGDSSYIHSFTRALAVQREEELFFANEGDFSDEIFRRPFPAMPIMEPVYFERVSLNPVIKVDHIDIISISSSAVLHIGNSKNILLESRVKNIRQLRERQ